MMGDLTIYDKGFLSGATAASDELAMRRAALDSERKAWAQQKAALLDELYMRHREIRKLHELAAVLWWVIAVLTWTVVIESFFLFWK
jgi:hypothetical protein